MFTLRSLHVPTKPLTVTSVPFVSESHGLCSGRGGGRSAAAAAAALSKRASVASARATSRSAYSCGTRALSVRYSEIIARSDTGSLNMASWSLSASSDAQSIGCCCCCSPVPPDAGGMAPGGAGRRADATAACPVPRYHPGPRLDASGRAPGPPSARNRLSLSSLRDAPSGAPWALEPPLRGTSSAHAHDCPRETDRQHGTVVRRRPSGNKGRWPTATTATRRRRAM